MAYTSTSLIKRARSLADLPNSEFISHQDEVDSLNEAYKYVYLKLVESDDDYFITTVPLTVDPMSKTLNDMYSVDLPLDFFSLRMVSFDNQGIWKNMQKYSPSQTNTYLSQPMYRIKNNKLYIKQPNNQFIANIQIDYYPKPEYLTKKQANIQYLSTILTPSTSISKPYFYLNKEGTIDETDYLFYVDTQSIRVASYTLGTDIELLSKVNVGLLGGLGSTVTSVQYWAGSLYFIVNGISNQLWKGTTDFLTLSSPSTILGAVVSSNFSITNNTLIIDDAGAALIYYSLITNSTFVPALTPTVFNNIIWTGTTSRWIDTNGLVNGTLFEADSIYWYNGFVYFVFKTALYRLDTDLIATLIRTDVYTPQLSGEISGGFIGTHGKYPISALGIEPDTEMDYPNNVFYEIISLSAAVDFKIKQNADPTLLVAKMTNMVTELEKSVKRDDYNVARINNYYTSDWGLR